MSYQDDLFRAKPRVMTLADGLPGMDVRIAVKVLGLTLLGATVTWDVVWSRPMPSLDYEIDVACSALLGMPTINVSSKTVNGCTVQFVTPLLATGATLIAIGTAPL